MSRRIAMGMFMRVSFIKGNVMAVESITIT